jgi:RNA-binding protein YlmH
MNELDAELALLWARVEDQFRKAERYEPAVGAFLSPRERFFVTERLKHFASDAVGVFYGGYDGSERCRLLVLPEYLAREDGEYTAANLREALPELCESAVSVLRIEGSGYRKLSHRDYLGSLLGLGIERDKLGDIGVSQFPAFFGSAVPAM